MVFMPGTVQLHVHSAQLKSCAPVRSCALLMACHPEPLGAFCASPFVIVCFPVLLRCCFHVPIVPAAGKPCCVSLPLCLILPCYPPPALPFRRYDNSNHDAFPVGDPSKRAFTYFVLTGGRFIGAAAVRLAVLKFVLSMTASKVQGLHAANLLQ